MVETVTPSAVNTTAPIQSRKDYKDTPRGQYDYWTIEIHAAERRLRDWQNRGDKIVERYLDSPESSARNIGPSGGQAGYRLNLFNSNIKTLLSMLYGQVPRADVAPTDTSGEDPVARTAADIVQRMLRNTLSARIPSFDSLYTATLQDRLLPGLGCVRVRYSMDEDDGVVLDEDAGLEYVYWGDVLWGWTRTYAELPWVAFRVWMTKDEVSKRFGEDVASTITLAQQMPETADERQPGSDTASAWQKAEIWEIWDKTRKRVVWYSKGHSRILDTRKDPLKLRGFFPTPPFFMANQTTRLYAPVADYYLSQDLYNTIDNLQTRIEILTEAVKVVGVYDADAAGIQRMFTEGIENDLIPVDNWAMFAEKGGLKGSIDWVPIEAVVNALDKLRQLRDETIGLLQQVTGMADVMRGELRNQYEGVGQTKQKVEFGSVRVQALQEQFAKFVAESLDLLAEVMVKHFDPMKIVELANLTERYPNVEHVTQALQLLKRGADLRVTVRPEYLAQRDYNKMQQERGEFLTGFTAFMQMAGPIMQEKPDTTPMMLRLLKWSMAGFRGAKEAESIVDNAIKAVEANLKSGQAQAKPSPEQIRAETQIKLEQMRMQSKQAEIQQKLQADIQMRLADKQADIQTKQADAQLEMTKVNMETQAQLAIMAAKMKADVNTELMTSQINVEQQNAATQAEIQKQIIKAEADIQKTQLKANADLQLKMVELEGQAALEGEKVAAQGRMEATKLAVDMEKESMKTEQTEGNDNDQD